MHNIRIGQAVDIHQLVEGRKLILGGVEIEHSKGLLGHSDAEDVYKRQAKITAILRRSYDFVSNHNILEYQGVRFNLDDNTVCFQSSQMELSKNEAKILRLLMEKKGTIVSRDRLMEYLWKTDFYVDENALSVNVNRLRKKLESIGIVDFIQTKKGLGYKI